MSNLREAAQQALEALAAWDALIAHQYSGTRVGMSDLTYAAQATPPIMEALRAALEQPEQKMPTKIFGPKLEEVLNACGFFKRKPLTDDEIVNISDLRSGCYGTTEFARAIEKAHGIGGEE